MHRSKYFPAIAFALLGLVWGSNFIYMKYAAAYINPMQIVFLRLVFGFVPVAVYAVATNALRWGQLKYFFHFGVMALIATVIYYYCFMKGVSLLYSGVAGALSGATPLFSFILGSLLLPGEKRSARKMIGLVIGLIGVVLIAKPFNAHLTSSTWKGVSFMIVGSMSLGASFIYARKFVIKLKLPAAALTTYQLFLATLIVAFMVDVRGITNILGSARATWGVIVGLGLLGTGLAYLLYYYIIEKMGAVSASSVTYIPPVVALLIGAVISHEPIGPVDYLGTGLILAGVMLLNSGPGK